MRAVVRESYGDTSVLRVAERDLPAPTGYQVHVAVAAAGVNMAEWHLMTGLPRVARLVLGPRAPRARGLGQDLVGTVVAVGDDVGALRVGDRVLGAGDGAFADVAVSRESRLVTLPDAGPGAVPDAVAAAAPLAGTTALHALRTGRVGAGSRVLVLGAGGGVGSLTTRLAVLAGARVVAATTPAKADVLEGTGAEAVVDRTDRGALLAAARERGGFDAVVVTGGLAPLRALRPLLAPRGTLALVGGEGGGTVLGGGLALQARAGLLDPWVGHRLRSVVARENRADLEHLRDLLVDGSLVPVLDRDYPLEEVAAAVDHLASGAARGKVVLTVS